MEQNEYIILFNLTLSLRLHRLGELFFSTHWVILCSHIVLDINFIMVT